MKNTIADRIADFLLKYPPFNHLSFDELSEIALSIKVIALEKNQNLFQIGDLLHDSFYIVSSGAVHLTMVSDAEETVLNKCVEGDIFGLRPFFAQNNYMMTAKALQESIIYAIPIAVFKPFVANNGKVLDFLLKSFASTSASPTDPLGSSPMMDNVRQFDGQSEIQYFQSLEYNKKPLLVLPDEMTQNVAQKMTDNLQGCVLVHENNLPIGILTDTDLRTKIATGRFYITALASKIMSAPVITVPENISLAEAQLFMLRNNVTHLCVTSDGTDKTEIKGIISQQDLIAAQASNPGILIKEIKKAMNALDLKKLRSKLGALITNSLDKRVPLQHINNIAAEVNMAIIKRAVDLAILDSGSPPARFAWLSIGSQGRKEQLLLTDQDSFLVFEDVAPDKYSEVRDYFLKLAKKVTDTLFETGYPHCPMQHMASNLIWCKSLTDWINQYNNWMNTPGEKTDEAPGIFFDYEIAFGDNELEEALTTTIFKNLENNKKFYAFLGTDALKKPAPLTFFKQFNVEEEGEHKNFFDIKNRAMMPLTDAARLLVLSHGIKGINNTYQRFKQLSLTEPRYAEIYLHAADAYLFLSGIRTREGLKNGNSGQYINLNELNKSDKEKLKNAFLPMKDLEEIIKNKFQLTYFT